MPDTVILRNWRWLVRQVALVMVHRLAPGCGRIRLDIYQAGQLACYTMRIATA
jgi:hypothetical protein